MAREMIAKDYIDEADWGSISTGTVPRNSVHSGPASSFKPTPFFFYGTLSIPEVLQQILDLSAAPILLKASTRMFKLKMWGPYPALVKPSIDHADDPLQSLGSEVFGVMYTVETEEHLKLLVAYEGENYAIAEILIELQGPVHGMASASVVSGKTFIWNGYPEQLTDGLFDPLTFRNPRAGV